MRNVPLSGAVKDPTIQKAINQVERAIGPIAGAFHNPPEVTGHTGGIPALESLLATLERAGLIVNWTTSSAAPGDDYPHPSHDAARAELDLWEPVASAASTELPDGRTVTVGATIMRGWRRSVGSGFNFAVVLHVSIAFAGEKMRGPSSGPNFNWMTPLPAYDAGAAASFVAAARDTAITAAMG